MSVNIIDTIKPKGEFPVADADDISVSSEKLSDVLMKKADTDTTNDLQSQINAKADATKAEDLQNQIDNLIGDVPAEAEVLQARSSVSGENYDTLKARLDEEYTKSENERTELKEDLSYLDYLKKWDESNLSWELGGYSSTTGEQVQTGGKTIRSNKMPISSDKTIDIDALEKDSAGKTRVRYAYVWSDSEFIGRFAAVNPFAIESSYTHIAFEYGYTTASGVTIESAGGVDAVASGWKVSVLSVVDVLAQTYPYMNKNIVCFGDSRTWYDGNTYISSTKSEWRGKTCIGYESEMRKILLANVVNEGVSGEKSTEICARIRTYDFTNVDAVLIEGGTNDVNFGVTIGELKPIGSNFDTSTVYGAYQSAIEYILHNYPKTKIYITIPAKCWINDILTPYEIVKPKGEIANLYALPCIDLYNNIQINEINRDYYYCDGNNYIHFNDYGNKMIGEAISEFLLSSRKDYDLNIVNIKRDIEETNKNIEKLTELNLAEKLEQTDGTSGGLAFTWNEEKNECTVSGTSTTTAYNTLYASSTELPYWLSNMNSIYLSTESTDENINLRIEFYLSDGTENIAYYKNQDAEIEIPKNIQGIGIRIYVFAGKQVDGAISIHITNGITRSEILRKLNSSENAIATLSSEIEQLTSSTQDVQKVSLSNASWESGSINATTGADAIATYAIRSDFIKAIPKTVITFTGANKDDDNVSLFAYAFLYKKDGTLIRRSGFTNTPVTIDDDAYSVRFTYAYTSASGKQMPVEMSERFTINATSIIDDKIASISNGETKGLFTFIDDDGYTEQLENWLEISKASGIKITECLVTGWTDGEARTDGEAPYIKPVSWDDVRKYQGTGFEFVSHTHSHAYAGGSRVWTEEEFKEDVELSQKALLEHGCNHEFLVYPGGHHDDTDSGLVDSVVRTHFKAAVAISNVANTTPLYTYSIFRYSVVDSTNGYQQITDSTGNTRNVYPLHTIEWFKNLIDDAIANDKWIVFMSHFYNYGDFYYNNDVKNTMVEVAKYIAQKGSKIKRLSEAFEERKNRFESAPRSKTVSYIVDRNGTIFDKH